MTSYSPDHALIKSESLASLQHLLIDGHNVLFGCSPLFGCYKAPEFPESGNRQLLIDASQTLIRSYPHLDIQLWFDGSEYLETQLTNGLRVLYSGGEGKGRADRGMIKSLANLKGQGAGPRAIVTADKALQRRARKNGALILLPDEFTALLAQVKEPTHEPTSEPT